MNEIRPRSRPSRLDSGNVRHGRLKKSNPFAAVAKILAGALAVVMVSSVSVAAIAAWDLANSVQPTVTLANETAGPPPAVGAIEGGVNLLLVGSDSRQGQGMAFGDPAEETSNLNDVTMLMHISEDHQNVSVISFPRDLFVSIPPCTDPETGDASSAMSSQKINTTLFYGGLSCTVATVEQLTGLSIPYAAEVQFNGVIEMSNAVGGVPVCIAAPIEDEYTGTFLEAGEHTLQGMGALQFLRTRHGVGDGSDIARISNQQVFLSSLVRTVKSAETLTDPLKLYGLAKAALNNMRLSNSLNNIDTIVAIAMALKDTNLENVVFLQYPSTMSSGGVFADEEAADILMTALLNDEPIGLNEAERPGSASVIDPGTGEAAPADPVDPADPATTPAPTSTAAPVTVLPGSVTGQTAGQLTCSNGRTLDDQ